MGDRIRAGIAFVPGAEEVRNGNFEAPEGLMAAALMGAKGFVAEDHKSTVERLC